MSNYPSFSEESVQNAIDVNKKHYSEAIQKKSMEIPSDNGHQSTLAECISVTIKNGKACLNIPIFGSVCIPVPISYDGKVASACLHVCTHWGIPTGVEITISIGGVVIVKKTFGSC